MQYALVLLTLLGAVAAEPPAAPQTQGLILDESACWRRFYRFEMNRISPTVLKAQGEAAVKGVLPRLKRDTENALRAKGIDPAKVDWRDHAVFGLGGGGSRGNDPAPMPFPPDDWMAPDFDDAAWVRDRGPFQSGPIPGITRISLGQYEETVDLRLQSAYYRTRFVVADPAAAAPLTLQVVYSGGVRVFVNRREVARGHLAQGQLKPDDAADDYPAAAYGAGGAAQCRRTLGPVAIPAAALRRGVNLLAVEVRASCLLPVALTNPIQGNWGGPQRPWPHARLISLTLRSGAAADLAVRRPPGVQVWCEDMHHRTLTTDFLPPGEMLGTLRFVAARNGTFAAQVVVGTDNDLADLGARAGDLVREGGPGRIPAAAIQVSHMAPFPADEWTLKRLGDERGLAASFPTNAELAAYAAMSDRSKVYLFDQLTAEETAPVHAMTCRPLWVSLRVPADAAPGKYRGALAVSAKRMAPVSLPVELDVIDWRLPDPKDFQTLVGCEENPYAVAKQYGVKPWSDEHLKLIEPSFRQLARIGNRWFNVPILAKTEFGNGTDSPVRWTRGAGGKLTADFAALDRYLDLAVKHCGTPRVIEFMVMQAMRTPSNPNAPATVTVFDAAGAASPLPVPSTNPAAWQALAPPLLAHMKARGLDKCMYWGAPWEQEADAGLKAVLAQCAPGVFWVGGGHEIMYNAKFCQNDQFYHIITDIRYQGGWKNFRDDEGWKSKTIHMACPRVGGTSFSLHTTSLPFAYRVMVDRALAQGRTGFTRVGADDWAAVHYSAMELPQWITGVPVLFTLWPGKNGAESSARFETLLEGIQETEARIFIEQAIDRGKIPGALAARARKTLADHFNETTFFVGNSVVYSMERYHARWQERSRRLYTTAAEVAKALQ